MAMIVRGRRQNRRDEREAFGRGGNAVRYRMREKLLSIGDDSWVEDADGQRVFKVNGKALRVRTTLVLEDLDGNELCKIQERKLRIKDSMEIERPDGDRLAIVKQALVTPLRARFDVKVENLDSATLRVVWVGLPRDEQVQLSISEDGGAYRLGFVQAAPPANSDALGYDRILVLRFDTDVSADDVEVTFTEASASAS